LATHKTRTHAINKEGWSAFRIVPFLHRSNCTVESLVLYRVSIPHEILRDILHSLPSLTSLVYRPEKALGGRDSEKYIFPPLMKSLLPSSSPTLLPLLTHLELAAPRLPISNILPVIKSRLASGNPLRTLVVSFCGEVNYYQREIGQLLETGLDVSIE
jgi:hypothetical protein